MKDESPYSHLKEEGKYYPHLRAYATYLVIKALKKIGPPNEISKITKPKQAGPLNVTLAIELGATLMELVAKTMGRGRFTDERARFIENQTVERVFYIAQKEEREKSKKLYMDIERLARYKERDLKDFGIAEFTRNQDLSCEILKRIGEEGWLRYKRKSLPKKGGNKYGDEVEREERWQEYKKLLNKYNEVKKTFDTLDGIIKEIEDEVTGRKDFEQDLEKHLIRMGTMDLQRKPIFDLTKYDHIYDSGAAAILRRTDRVWWNRYSSFVNNEFNKEIRKPNLLRLKLRDFNVIAEAINRTKKNNVVYKTELIDILNDLNGITSFDWRKDDRFNSDKKMDYDDRDVIIRECYVSLRKEDKEAREWLDKEGGTFHPYNIYESHINPESYRRNLIKFKEYCVYQSSNELHWCLCGSNRGLFVMNTFLKYSEVDWIRWEKDALEGKPRYWSRK